MQIQHVIDAMLYLMSKRGLIEEDEYLVIKSTMVQGQDFSAFVNKVKEIADRK